MDQDQSFELVNRKSDISLVLAILMPMIFAALILTLSLLPTARRPTPWAEVILAWLAGTVVFDVYVLSHRARARSTRLIASDEGLTLRGGGRELWRFSWKALASVSLRKYTLKYSYFDEAMVIEPAKGKAQVVPTASALYGRMPGLEELLDRIESEGVEVRLERRPPWVTP